MKKLFWVTTALVTLGGISVAAADVSISGNTRMRYHTWSDDQVDGAGSTNSNSEFANDLFLWVNADMVADSGLEYGAGIRFRATGATDRNQVYMRDDWGQITLGRTWGPEYTMSLGANWRGTGVGQFNVADYEQNEDDNAAIKNSFRTISGKNLKVVYATPKISGLKAAVSFADDGRTSKADVTAFGVNYTAGFMGDSSLRLGYVQESKSKSGTKSKDKRDEVGVEFSNGPILASIIKMTRKAGDDKGNGTEFEIALDATDALVLNVIHLNSKVDGGTHNGDKFKSTTLGAAYTVAPGLIIGVAHQQFDADDSNPAHLDSDGTETRFQVRLNF